LLETKYKVAGVGIKAGEKKLSLFFRSRLYHLSGNCQWTLQTDHLLCSDVIFSNPSIESLDGTLCLIHPDDIPVIDKLTSLPRSYQERGLKFRVINTHGLVGEVSCAGIINCIEEQGASEQLFVQTIRKVADDRAKLERSNHDQLVLMAWEFSGRVRTAGVLYYNTSTYETFFSDEVFRIHGLPPDSLNHHLQSFDHLIHPEDLEAVTRARETAYRDKLPLRLEYRIFVNGMGTRYVVFANTWSYSINGDAVLVGFFTDITEEKTRESEQEYLTHLFTQKENILRQAEAIGKMASWSLNLVTRKIEYSDQVYRIFGLKPSDLPLNALMLQNYVHPEDQARVAEVNRKILIDHTAPDLVFRIIRSDGRVRFLRQKGKLLSEPGKELTMIGTIIDTTDFETREKKFMELRAGMALQQTSLSLMEEQAGAASWILDLDSGESTWSKGIYELTGQRQGTVPMNMNVLLNLVHAEDRQKITGQLAMVRGGTPYSEFIFRLQRRHEIRHIQACFRLVNVGESHIFFAGFLDKTNETLLTQQVTEKLHFAEMLSDASIDRVFVTDANNYVIQWNKKCEEAYGLKKERAIGKNFFDLFPELKIQTVLSRFDKAFKGEFIQVNEEHGLLTPGHQQVLMVPLKDDKRQVIAVLTVLRDITHEYELRQQLKNRLQFIEKLLEASVDRIIVLDMHMNYLYWNKKAEIYYGIGQNEVIGKNILELFPGVIDDPAFPSIRKALKGETVIIPASRNLADRKGYFETYLIPIRGEGPHEIIGVLWIAHDLIGEYNLAQQQRKANYILQNINEAYLELDFKGNICYVNPGTEKYLNMPRESLLGQNIFQILDKDAPLSATIFRVLEEKTDRRDELFDPVHESTLLFSCTITDESVIILFYDPRA